MRISRVRALTTAVVSVLLVATRPAAADYTFTKLFSLGPGGGAISGADETVHAMLWNGTAASAADLNPVQLGMSASMANGTDGTHQVGTGTISQQATTHAILWTGTATSAVDLNPTKLFGAAAVSEAFGVDGAHQVGSVRASLDFTSFSHALLWSSSADSAIDLQPATTNLVSTKATAVSGNQQVGSGLIGPFNTPQALVWNGTADSMVDLQPSGFTQSEAYGTNGIQQVGIARTGPSHAVVWSGTVDSMVDLTTFMPLSPINDSKDPYFATIAVNIDSTGNIFGFADDLSGNEYAVEWAATPEPSAISLTVLGLAALLKRRR